MNATAKPRILYFEMKSLNSFKKPLGGTGDGAFSKAALIFFNSANISSSLSILITSVLDNSLLWGVFVSADIVGALTPIFSVIISSDCVRSLISAVALCPTTAIPVKHASFVSYPSLLSAIISPFLAFR